MTINRLIAIFFLTEILYHCYEYILGGTTMKIAVMTDSTSYLSQGLNR